MSDLEDLWNSLPTGPPPTGQILHQGRVNSGWRRVRRPVMALGAAAALTGAFVAGTVVPDLPNGGDGDGGLQHSLPSPVAFTADLHPAASCEALLATYVDRALGRVTAWGWDSPDYYWNVRGVVRVTRELYKYVPQSGLTTDRVTASETGTNVQEELVDEPDSVKTDGRLLVRLRDDELQVYDVSGAKVARLAQLRLEGVDDGEILLADDTVVVIGADRQSPRSEQTGARAGTRVQTVSLADPSAPEVTDDVTYTAAAASARQHGDTIRMVLSSGLPDLPFVHPNRHRSAKASLVRNREIVKRSELEDWLPTYDVGDGGEELLECGDVAVPPAKVGMDTAAVVTFSATNPTEPQAFGLAGATTIAYESVDKLYLASTPGFAWGCRGCFGSLVASGTSYLFQFDLTDDTATHVASGEVEGTIADRWSMDEADGELRVLVGPSSETGNFNSIVTFERRGQQLVETGRLGNLGPGEQVKSVRWQDDLALVVTFRQVDPLYVVDLRGRPELVSELKVPGFSSYLHPLGTQRLIGVGYGPGRGGWGAQMGLFKVRDLEQIRRLDLWHYGRGTSPVAGSDPRSFTWLPHHRTVLTVIRKGGTGWLSIQRLAQSQLHNRMIKVEYGADVADVRTIGMADGRTILVTGEDVRFLRL